MGGSTPPPPFPLCGESYKHVSCGEELCPCLYPEIRCEGP
jgi:hypothetical protein